MPGRRSGPCRKASPVSSQGRPVRRFLVTGSLGLILALVGCGNAVIRRFNVDPTVGCRDANTRVSWDVSGDASLEVEPTRPGQGMQPDTLAFILTVKKGRSERSDHREALRFPPLFEDFVSIDADDNAAGDSLVADGEKNPERWDETFAIETASSGSDRVIVLTHDGRSVTLPADGSPVSGLAGLRVGGRWRLSSALLPAEASGDAVPPPILRVRLTATCRE